VLPVFQHGKAFFDIRNQVVQHRSFSNVAKACTFILSKGFPTIRSSFMARPFGITTIMGSIFPSAYRLSRITCGVPPLSHSLLSSRQCHATSTAPGIFCFGKVGRCIDNSPSLCTNCFRLVGDGINFAVSNILTHHIEPGRCRFYLCISRCSCSNKSARTSANGLQ
jgi:hypothetical protein